MTIENIIAVVNTAKTKEFKVVVNGNVEKKRLFVSSRGELCEYIKRSKRYGYPLNDYQVCHWESITPCKQTDDLTKIKNFMNKVVKYLNKSGMWSMIKTDYEIILAQGDDFLADLINSSWTDKRDKLHKLAVSLGRDSLSFHCDSIVDTARKGIKSVNYDRYGREIYKPIVKSAIENKTTTMHKWRKGYDNSVEVRMNNDILCGWYCEEYKDCGNGHYYLLLDECHAFFYEND